MHFFSSKEKITHRLPTAILHPIDKICIKKGSLKLPNKNSIDWVRTSDLPGMSRAL